LLVSLLLSGILFSACIHSPKAASPNPVGSSPTTGVSLAAEASSYRPGDQVVVTLQNNTSNIAGYNLCFAFLELQRQVSDSWKSVRALGPNRQAVCTTELRGLQPGTQADGRAYLPTTLSPGIYRIALRVEIGIGNAREMVATDGFSVRS
jgi:hypothetical protein